MKKKLFLVLLSSILFSFAFAVDSIAVSRSGKAVRTSAPVFTTVSANYVYGKFQSYNTTSAITVTTGNVNLQCTVNGVLLYIKANTNP